VLQLCVLFTKIKYESKIVGSCLLMIYEQILHFHILLFEVELIFLMFYIERMCRLCFTLRGSELPEIVLIDLDNTTYPIQELNPEPTACRSDVLQLSYPSTLANLTKKIINNYHIWRSYDIAATVTSWRQNSSSTLELLFASKSKIDTSFIKNSNLNLD